MTDFYSTWQMQFNEQEKNSSKRLLRKLKIALIVWVIIFIIAMLWFSLSS